MPSYLIHGLTIASETPLPGLIGAPADCPADVQCEFCATPAPGDDGELMDVPRAVACDGMAPVLLYRRPEAAAVRLRYADGTTFDLAEDGSSLCSYTPSAATLADTLTYLYGPVLALALRMRGVLALHASGVLVDGRAVLLVGGNGAGKSTTAAACARAGLTVLSDDVVALRERDGQWWAFPGYDHLRLWPESEVGLFGAGSLPLLTPTWDKRVLPLRAFGYQHHAEPALLAAVYVLGERDASTRAPRAEPLAARDALMLLVSNAAASRLMTTQLRRLELGPLGRLVAAHPPRQLVARDDPAELDALVACLVADLGAITGAATEPGGA